MSASVNQLQSKTTEADALASTVRQQSGVRTLAPQILTLPGLPPHSLLPDDWLKRLGVITPAFAAELNAVIQQRGFDAGKVIDEAKYLIVIGSFPTLEQLPIWGFDGSSTRQAEGLASVENRDMRISSEWRNDPSRIRICINRRGNAAEGRGKVGLGAPDLDGIGPQSKAHRAGP